MVQEGEREEAPTPYYNNSLIEDMLYQTHQKLIHEQLQNSPSVVDAILLFKVLLITLSDSLSLSPLLDLGVA